MSIEGEHSDRPIISNFIDWRVPCIQSGRNGGGCRGGWFLSLPILQILQSRAVSAGLLGNEDTPQGRLARRYDQSVEHCNASKLDRDSLRIEPCIMLPEARPSSHLRCNPTQEQERGGFKWDRRRGGNTCG